MPKDLGLPFSRLSRNDIAQQTIQRGIVASISGAKVWRWLSADAIRPWCYRSWIWPRDPHFEQKAGRILDLYHRTWNGKPLGDEDFVVCSDEKTSIQARRRLKPTVAPVEGRPGRSIIVAGAKDSFMSFGLYDTLSMVKLLTALH
ncbi:MAG: hypothetical protein JRI76_05715 [Deltaproteobacteria bacterium]|nr:hypothetical protein [Deltaproteobacteria bacterium]MBW1954384.1 hypothetical protein [Deltaproteobacteria bacterium]MBW2041516.1 hypothetical protein [Deltaproteobacteria bacterium]MBW2131594.1 hypothetical protein [Deltaproteobacteria bacterium]